MPKVPFIRGKGVAIDLEITSEELDHLEKETDDQDLIEHLRSLIEVLGQEETHD